MNHVLTKRKMLAERGQHTATLPQNSVWITVFVNNSQFVCHKQKQANQ